MNLSKDELSYTVMFLRNSLTKLNEQISTIADNIDLFGDSMEFFIERKLKLTNLIEKYTKALNSNV